MSGQRDAREEEIYRRLRYPGTDVLINKLDIRDAATLEVAERRFVRIRQREGLPPAARRLDYAGFKAIHRHLFQDVYAWAGQERTYTTGRDVAPFARPEYIASSLEPRFALLKSENHLKGLDPKRFAERAAEHVNEINAAHPFIEGNGRTQRTWLRQLALQAGYRLTLKSEDRAAWYEASRIGFAQVDHAPMAKLIESRLKCRER